MIFNSDRGSNAADTPANFQGDWTTLKDVSRGFNAGSGDNTS